MNKESLVHLDNLLHELQTELRDVGIGVYDFGGGNVIVPSPSAEGNSYYIAFMAQVSGHPQYWFVEIDGEGGINKWEKELRQAIRMFQLSIRFLSRPTIK